MFIIVLKLVGYKLRSINETFNSLHFTLVVSKSQMKSVVNVSLIILLATLRFSVQGITNSTLLVEEALIEVRNQAEAVNVSLWKFREYRHHFEETVRSLDDRLPQALVNTYLKEYIDNLEELAGMGTGDVKEKCFVGVQQLEGNLRQQAELYFKSCTSRIKNFYNINDTTANDFPPALDQVNTSIDGCKQIRNLRRQSYFTNVCLDSAKTSFYEVLLKLNSSLETQEKRSDNVEVLLTECITVASDKAVDFLKQYNKNAKQCITRMSNNNLLLENLDNLIYDPENLNNILLEQIQYNDSKYDVIINELQNDLKLATEAVNKTVVARALLSNLDFQTFVCNAKINNILLEETKVHQNVSETEVCVLSLTFALQKICENEAMEVQSCAETIPDINMTNFEQITHDFQNLSHPINVKLDCLANTDSLFSVGGIQKCIEVNRASNHAELFGMKANLYDILEQATVMEINLTSCKDTAWDNASSQQYTNIQHFKMCIDEILNL